MNKRVLLTVVIILLISVCIAGCAEQNYNPVDSPGQNKAATATPGIGNGNQSPASTVTASPGTTVSPQNNYTGSGNLGGASDIG